MKKILLPLLTIIFFLSCLPEGFTQTPVQERRLEEDKRKRLLAILTEEGKRKFDYGGWLYFTHADYKDEDNNSSLEDILASSFSYDLRLWIRSSGPSNSFYLRFKNYSLSRQSDSEETEAEDERETTLDMGYLTLEFRPFYLLAGRRYFGVGQGIAYSNVHDGVELAGYPGQWNLKAFFSQTLPDEENLDTSVPGYEEGSKRTFYGAEIGYIGFKPSLYAYFVNQEDYSEESPEDSEHDYHYDSQYLGFGIQGKLGKIHYWGELINQTGKSYIYEINEKKDVEAQAWNAGITYDWAIATHPSLVIDYASASGDPDRADVTNTEWGNYAGKDTNFLYFGYFPGGYALAPRLSNLNMLKLECSLLPLEKFKSFKDLILGLKFYQYSKNEAEGAIYDLDASEESKDVGKEFDLYLKWRILSDLSCTIEYGYFLPGEAYADSADDPTQYFSTSLMLTF